MINAGRIHDHLESLGYRVETVRVLRGGDLQVELADGGDEARALAAARAYAPTRSDMLTLSDAIVLRLAGEDADADKIIAAEAARIKSRLRQ